MLSRLFWFYIQCCHDDEGEILEYFASAAIRSIYYSLELYFFWVKKKNPEKFVLIAGKPRVYLRFNCRGSTIISLASKSKKNSPEGCTRGFSFVYYRLRDVVFLARSPPHLALVIVYPRYAGKLNFSSSDVVRVFSLNSVLKSLFDDRN